MAALRQRVTGIGCIGSQPSAALSLQAGIYAFGQQTDLDIDSGLLEPLSGHSHRTPEAECCCQRQELRHILLGSPGAIRQAIHQLHVLNYAESVLWSPLVAVNSHLVITPEQGEAMSLLRR